MKKRELWLKLFSENDTALAAAIHLCERFVTPVNLEGGIEFLAAKRRELYNEVDQETVESVFPGCSAEQNEQDQGRWVVGENGSIYCSKCRTIDDYASVHYFCPFCGVRIVLEGKCE